MARHNLLAATIRLIAAVMFLASSPAGTAAANDRPQVANFAVADHPYGSPGFERLSFSIGRGGKFINYAYGATPRSVTLQAIGPAADGRGLAVRFPNGLVLDIVAAGDGLQVSDRKGAYSRNFTWLYEGPVNGRGTACISCVEEDDAVAFVHRHFIRMAGDAETKAESGISGRYRVGSTGILCVREPCPWRGIIQVSEDDGAVGRPIVTELPTLEGTEADRRRIASAWDDYQCLVVEGILQPSTLTVHRIIGAC